MDFREITFEELEKACTGLQTTNIKGKEYVQVNERVKAFRTVYPTGYILARMVSNENGVCIFEARVGFYTYAEDGFRLEHDLATGTAFEVQNASYINKTSYLENCETSAIGRALGFAGFGLDVAIASAEEVTNAIEQQSRQATISDKDVLLLEAVCKDCNINVKALLKQYKVKELKELTAEQFRKINEDIARWRESQNAQPQG